MKRYAWLLRARGESGCDVIIVTLVDKWRW